METRAEEIFADAMELGPGEREEFLGRACGGDACLRREVELLLADAAKAETFFEELTRGAEGLPARSPSERAGGRIGPYTLLHKIGEGGFGVVWKAEQARPIARSVAIKVIKAGMDTEEVLARFESERQALARMEHPNIARVLDAGATENGRPYFAMELVEGVPITKYCEENALDTKARLQLFADVCAAVNHAHQKGVIHRDLKPSNILVSTQGGKPVAKVIDFGIAKAIEGKLTDETLVTQVGQPLGTPAYMSPEQAGLGGLDIDTRTDIYALGALLYELLVGAPPFDPKTLLDAGYEEMRRIIREVDPVLPSARITSMGAARREEPPSSRKVPATGLLRAIASDLDWIVMKAMDKQRERRYETADALEQDIFRFLSDQPVTAKPPTPGYLLRKFIRRNRIALQMALALFLLLAAGAAVSSWQAVRATKAEAIARNRLSETVRERNAKDRALHDAEEVSAFLAEVFQRPDPEIDGRTVTVAAALDAATEKLNSSLRDQPERLALLQETLAGTYEGLGLYPRSLDLRRRILETRRKCLGVESPATLESMRGLVMILTRLGFYEEARKLGEEEVRLRKRVNGKNSPATGRATAMLGINTFHAGRHEEAVALMAEAFTETMGGAKCLMPQGSETLASSLAAPAPQYLRQSRGRDAAAWFDSQMSEILEGQPPFKIPVPERWLDDRIFASRLGISPPSAAARAPGFLPAPARLFMTKQLLEKQEADLAELRQKAGPSSRQAMNATRALAARYRAAGYPVDAMRLQEALVAVQREKYGEDHPDTFSDEEVLAYYLWRSGQWEKSVNLRRSLIERGKKLFGPEHLETLSSQADMAQKLFLRGQFGEAMAMAEEAVPLLRKVAGPHNRRTLDAISELARCYASTGRTLDATRLLEECCPQMRDDTFVNLMLAGLQLWQGMDDGYKATRLWMLDYAAREGGSLRNRPDILERNSLICCLAPLDNEAQSRELLATLSRCQALRDNKDRAPDRGPGPAWVKMVNGIVHYRTGDYEAAAADFAESTRLRQMNANPSSQPDAEQQTVGLYLAMTLFQQGKYEEARKLFNDVSSKVSGPQSEEAPLMNSVNAEGGALVPWLALREARKLFAGTGGDGSRPADALHRQR